MKTVQTRLPAVRWPIGYVPWSKRAWLNTAFAVGGIPVQLASLAAVAAPLLLVIFSALPGAMLPAAAVWVAAALFLLPSALTVVQRRRFSVMLGIDIPSQGAGRRLGRSGFVAYARSGKMWREAVYHLIVSPVIAVGGLAVGAAWMTGSVLATLYAYEWTLPLATALRQGEATWDPVLTIAGIALLIAAPWLAASVARADTLAVSALLGPSKATQLALRVDHLARSRADMVDAAAAERRRIERDLHDGIQSRLVSLSIDLGIAQATLDPAEQATAVVVSAHNDVKAILAQLRNLVRGLYPAVLNDRGLDAALSGIAAAMPLPVSVRIDLAERPPPAVEAAAYFIVSEALTNVVKHAKASQASVTVRAAGGILRVIVTDDGVGGAEPAGGTGLAGLAARARAADGTFSIRSPAGGPTRLTAELPCAS